MKNKIYHIGISGGKDSTALLLWMVYAHIRMIGEKIMPVIWLETEGFEQLVRKHKIFPTTHRRYCTKELKLIPTKRFLEALSEKYDEIIPVSGVRRDESFERSKLQEWGASMESYFGLKEWRPLIHWKIEDILAIHAKYKIPLNPLYSKGASRVGCFPCINSNKNEIRAMILHHPERIDQIRKLEDEMLKMHKQPQTFFASNKVPWRFRSATYIAKSGRPVKVCTIDDVVAWAKTGWRAKGSAPDIGGLFQWQLAEMEPILCLSQYQACE